MQDSQQKGKRPSGLVTGSKGQPKAKRTAWESLITTYGVATSKNYKKYDRKQLILSHMLPPSEMYFKCRRCSMKN